MTLPNEKKLFSISTRRLADSAEGLNSSLAQSAGELWPEMSRPLWWPTRYLKGATSSKDDFAPKCLKTSPVYSIISNTSVVPGFGTNLI